MAVGGKYRLTVPSSLAYGSEGAGEVIPPYATLVFEVSLLSIEPAEAEAPAQ
jgi:FKBP-type peptidyl-prolyl cis-trans isomerase